MSGWRFRRKSNSQAFPMLALALIWAGSVGAGARAFAQQPDGASAPDGTSWRLTFDDEFTGDSSLNTNYWNGGAGDTDWCDEDAGGEPAATFFFHEDPNNPCAQVYTGLSLDSNGLTMTSNGYPSAAIQTDGTTASNAKFIQRFGFWEARFRIPNMSDGGSSAHSDFWLHTNPMTGNDFAPEFNIGERPTWLSGNNDTTVQFTVADGPFGSGNGPPGCPPTCYGDSAGDDLSQDFHTYGVWWKNDGSGPYGSVQFYLDGTALLSSPYTLNSNDSNLASGIYTLLSLDQNDPNSTNDADPFIVQYVRVWQDDLSVEGAATGFPVYGDYVDYNLGTKFYTTENGNITGLRIYGASGESGNHLCYLFNDTSPWTTNLGTWNFNGNNTWITKSISPVAITTGYDYTISISTGDDSARHYPADIGGFGNGGTNNNVLYWYSGSGVYGPKGSSNPTNVYRNNNYLRDILFEPN